MKIHEGRFGLYKHAQEARDEWADEIKAVPKEGREKKLESLKSRQEYKESYFWKNALQKLYKHVKGDVKFDFTEKFEDPVRNNEKVSNSFPESWSRLYKESGFLLAIEEGDIKDEAKEELSNLRKMSYGRIFLDLGCGNRENDSVAPAAKLAELFGGEAYFGIDKFNINHEPMTNEYKQTELSNNNLSLNTWNTGKEPKHGREMKELWSENSIPSFTHRGDMLETLKKFKNDSAVVILNGIEKELFNFDTQPTIVERYFNELKIEIKRVIGEGGYIITSTHNLPFGEEGLIKSQQLSRIFDGFINSRILTSAPIEGQEAT